MTRKSQNDMKMARKNEKMWQIIKLQTKEKLQTNENKIQKNKTKMTKISKRKQYDTKNEKNLQSEK